MSARLARIASVALAVAMIAVGVAAAERRGSAAAPVRVSAEGTTAAEPAVATGPGGAIYVVWIEHRGEAADVWLERRDGALRRLGEPVRVNATAGEATAWFGDPPTVAVAPEGAVYVGWSRRDDDASRHAATVCVSTSRDGGRSFEPAVPADATARADQGLHSLAAGRGGRVYVAWLDERSLPPKTGEHAAGGHHMPEPNREVYVAASTDGGRSFGASRRVAPEACPCCKTSLAIATDGRVYVSWRQVLEGDFRHIAVASSAAGATAFSAPAIVSDDRWHLTGCPVSGAALRPDGASRLDVLWYSAGADGPAGLYTAESRDGGRHFGPRRLVREAAVRGTPRLLANGRSRVALWEATGEGGARVSTAGMDGRAAPSVFAGGTPAAVVAGKRIVVAYTVKEGDRSAVFVTTIDG